MSSQQQVERTPPSFILHVIFLLIHPEAKFTSFRGRTALLHPAPGLLYTFLLLVPPYRCTCSGIFLDPSDTCEFTFIFDTILLADLDHDQDLPMVVVGGMEKWGLDWTSLFFSR